MLTGSHRVTCHPAERKPHPHSDMSSKVLVYWRNELGQDIQSMPLKVHEMILMSSLYRLTKSLFPVDPRPKPWIKTETRAHVIAFNALSSVCEYFHQVITKQRSFRRLLKRRLTVACRPYRLQPRLLSRVATGHSGAVTGVTKLDNRLYIVYELSPEIIVYNTEQQPPTKLRSLHVNGMKDPCDMAASINSNCLYVADRHCVWKVIAEPKVCQLWIDALNAISLSVTPKGHLLILIMLVYANAATWRGQIEVYNADKLKLTILKLPQDIINPQHLAQTANKSFIVSYGDHKTGLYRVVEVNNEGSTLTSYGGPPGCGLGQLNAPWNVALDNEEKVLVADTGNRRVLLLSRQLNIERVILIWPVIYDIPSGLHYDRGTSQLVVGLRSGHVDIYSV